jgi:hypothetical protein
VGQVPRLRVPMSEYLPTAEYPVPWARPMRVHVVSCMLYGVCQLCVHAACQAYVVCCMLCVVW